MSFSIFSGVLRILKSLFYAEELVSMSTMQQERWGNFAQPVNVEQNLPKSPPKSRCIPGPDKRSGHRVFATEDYLYVVGGFNSLSASVDSSTFRDIWMLNLLTKQWKPTKLIGSFDDTMASFSLTFVPELNKFYVYGGTGFPFGENVSNQLYECTLIENDCCKIEKVKINGEAPKIYGQSSVYQLDYNRNVILYLTGGTQGYQYHSKVYEFCINRGTATCKQISKLEEEPEGRYRHESFIHNEKIYSIGGSNDNQYSNFDKIIAFDLKSNSYHLQPTYPSKEEYPKVRKGHSLIKYGKKVYIFGGLCPAENIAESLLDDIWSFDCESFYWEKCPATLPESVFFHAGTVTPNGQVLSYGGCVSSQPDPTRTHKVSTFYVVAPTLLWMSTCRLYELSSDLLKNSGDIQFTNPVPLVHQVLSCKGANLELANNLAA